MIIVKHTLQLKATDFKTIIMKYPDFMYQHRKHILVKKIAMIMKNSNKSVYYMRDLFMRHPELFTRSFASFIAKERFLKVYMGKNLKEEMSFPLLMKMNLNSHIKPRCELVYKRDQQFDLTSVLVGTDEEF